MDVGRRGSGIRSSVVAGSVWESRMKLDEVKGGIRVFNGYDKDKDKERDRDRDGPDQQQQESGGNGGKKIKRSPIGIGVSGKRKTWKSEGFDKSPIQIAKGRSVDEQCKELSVSVSVVEGIKKKSPIQGKKLIRSTIDGGETTERSPIQGRKLRSADQLCKELGESGEGREKNPSVLSWKDPVQIQIQLREAKPEPELEPNEVVDEPEKSNGGGSAAGIETNPVEMEESGSEEACKEFGVCQEKVISSNASQIKSGPKVLVSDDDGGNGEEEEQEEEEEENVGDDEFEDMEVEIEKKSIDIKEINVPEHKEIEIPEQKPNKIVIEERKIRQLNTKPVTMSSTVRRQPPTNPPVTRRSTIDHRHHHPTKPTPPVSDQYQRFPQTQNKLQSLVDLVMWRDVSRSAFVFEIGTFVIISSSYTQDLNISPISVISYLGLFYLAAIFLYKSIICRGVIDIDDTSYVVGEGEAIWLLKLFLPYLNELLLKLRTLFSGDPATTMKLAVLLFVFARCGSSITIWKMAKFGFFGVFTVPKVCSSYSTQITAYGKFWIRRFGDAWDSCTHKKAVAVAIFTLVWNLSSIVARVWAVFMMFVAIRYYQQSMMVRDDWVEDDDTVVGNDQETIWQQQGRTGTTTQNGGGGGQRQQGRGPTIIELNSTSNKAKKRS